MDTQVPSGSVGEPAMESGDWRAQQQADSRQRAENKMYVLILLLSFSLYCLVCGYTFDLENDVFLPAKHSHHIERHVLILCRLNTLKSNLLFSRHEELKKIAKAIEEVIYTVATSQSEYTRKICFMMLSLETRLQYTFSDPLDSTANGGDWQQDLYQKLKAMKDMYFLDLNKRLDRTDAAIGYIMSHQKVVFRLPPRFQHPLRERPQEPITLEYIVERSNRQDATIRYMMTQLDITIPEFFKAHDDQGTSTGGDAPTGDDSDQS